MLCNLIRKSHVLKKNRPASNRFNSRDKTEKLLHKCLAAFDNTKRMLSAKYGAKFRTELDESLQGHIQDLKKLNDEKRAAKLLQTPLVLIGSIFVCWVAISILGNLINSSLHKGVHQCH